MQYNIHNVLYARLIKCFTTIISPGMGMGSFFLKRSLKSFTPYRNTVHTSPIIRVTILVLVMFMMTASMLWVQNKTIKHGFNTKNCTSQMITCITLNENICLQGKWKKSCVYKCGQWCWLPTWTTEKGPLKRAVGTPSRYLSCETETWTAAAVVKPRTRGSVR